MLLGSSARGAERSCRARGRRCRGPASTSLAEAMTPSHAAGGFDGTRRAERAVERASRDTGTGPATCTRQPRKPRGRRGGGALTRAHARPDVECRPVDLGRHRRPGGRPAVASLRAAIELKPDFAPRLNPGEANCARESPRRRRAFRRAAALKRGPNPCSSPTHRGTASASRRSACCARCSRAGRATGAVRWRRCTWALGTGRGVPLATARRRREAPRCAPQVRRRSPAAGTRVGTTAPSGRGEP